MRTNDEIVNIISNRAEEKGLSLSELARRVGMAKSAISRYFNKTREFPINRVNEFAKVLDLTPEYILGFDNGTKLIQIFSQLEPPRKEKVMDCATDQLNEQNNVIEFPDRAKELIRGRRMAGGSALHVDDTDARKEVVSSALIPKGADELVEVVGKSMEPLIKDREEVYIRYQPTVENGEIAVVRIENEGVTCKRVYVEENSIRLKAENPDYEDMYYDAGQVTILGKVLL